MSAPVKAKDAGLRLLLASATAADGDLLVRHFNGLGVDVILHQADCLAVAERALDEREWDALIWAADGRDLPLASVKTLMVAQGVDLPLIALVDGGRGRPRRRFAREAGVRGCFSRDDLEHLLPAIEREVDEVRYRADHRAALEMLNESENRFRALASNLPGMVFQLARIEEGAYRFLYVSEGGQKLLGLKPHELLSTFLCFLDVIAPADRPSLLQALETSARAMATLNWEGRTWGRGQPRQKWINLRSSPEIQSDGSVHWHGIATDISRSKEAEMALRRSREQLAELSSYLEGAKEAERERIARDIHDELGSLLVAIKIEMSLLAGKLPKSSTQLQSKAESIEKLLDQAMGTASRVARDLRPGILKEFGLQAAIECQSEDFTQRTGVACRVKCDDELSDVDEPVALALFRIVQEALTNVAKHAHASLVAVRVWREDTAILLEVRDNGRGISDDDMGKPRSFGLRGIRERVRSLNGVFGIEAGEQGGTRLFLRVPPLGPVAMAVEEDRQKNLF